MNHKRCGNPVSFEQVTTGYFAQCPTCDEDLFSFEVVPIERDVMEVRWTCGDCENTNDLSCPVWEDINGEYVVIECPDCLKVLYVSLDLSVVTK